MSCPVEAAEASATRHAALARPLAALLSCLLLYLCFVIPLTLLLVAVLRQGLRYSVIVSEWATLENVQAMLEFLMENDCPRVLRTRIVQYVRFAEEHHDNNVRKQVMIEKLPADLRTELLGHLFSPLMQRVPVFGFIRSSAGARTSDCFLAKVADITPDVMPLSAAVVARRQATAVGPRCVTGV